MGGQGERGGGHGLDDVGSSVGNLLFLLYALAGCRAGDEGEGEKRKEESAEKDDGCEVAGAGSPPRRF